ncbi:MAG: thioredoxin family protein [Terracidiphilus sp.]|jgi:thiol:disulfide interchange protein DsbD
MRIPRLIFALSLLLAVAMPMRAESSSADTDHVHVQLVFRNAQLYPGAGDHGGLFFKLEPGWHVYWKNPGDAGLPPHIRWTLPEGITAEALQFTAPKRLPLGPLMDYGYEGEVLFPFRLEIAKSVKPGVAVLHAKVDWLVCQASCIPGKADLEITQKILAAALDHAPDDGPGAEIWKRLARLIPDALPPADQTFFQPTKDGLRLTVETGRRETTATFFPEDQDILDNPAPQKLTPTVNGLILDLKKDASLTANPAQLKGVLELSGGRNYDIVASPPGVKAVSSGETKPSEQQASGANPSNDSGSPIAVAEASPSQPASIPTAAFPAITPSPLSWALLLRSFALAFLGGLLLNLMPCVFPVLFLKGLALVNSGNEERAKLRTHGLVYAAGILVSFWALVSVLLGLRAAGATLGWGFQFQSPIFLALMAGLLFFLGLSLAGQFEIGLTLTSAGGALLVDKQGAQKQGYTGSFFTGVLAVVVATPCTAPFMGAAVGYALAQSAAVTFAVFTALAFGLAAPYLALTLQPAWTRLLPKPGVWMEVLRQAVAVPIFATVIWLAWVLAGGYGSGLLASLLGSFLLLAVAGWFLGRWPAKRWSSIVAAAILLGVVALDALAPQKLTTAPETLSPPEMRGLWQPWSQAAVSRSLAAGQPVFVDFTASWCLSCQVNERAVLNQPDVIKAFQGKNVVLMKADWTRHDEAITQALTGLGRSGVPAYALYAPRQSQPRLLPEVLTPGIVIDAVNKLAAVH